MTPMTPTEVEAKLAEIRAGLEGVTPGPWATREARFDGEFEVYPTRPDEDLEGFSSWSEIATVNEGGDDEPAEAIAAHIARLDPATVLSILSYVESLKAERDQAVGAGWHLAGTEPLDGKVLGGRWSTLRDEFVTSIVSCPLTYPFTHWHVIPAPPAAGATDA